MMATGAETMVTDAAKGIVFIVDDDASVRRGLGALFRSAGLSVEVFGSASEMAQSPQSESVTPGW
jgi:FixJ family two-component response regulator